MKTIVGSRKHQFIATVSILLIAVALIAVIVVCEEQPPISEIRTWYDLDAIRDNLGGNYTLMNDLDSTTEGYEELASETANEGKGWQPIGAFIDQMVGHGVLGFMGTLDGQGYEIRDLSINRPNQSYIGLFLGVGQEGVIKDIGLVNATLTGNVGVGALSGWNHGTVSNSYSMGNVTGHDQLVGGLVGLNSRGTISNSYATGSVTGQSGVGGLVGFNSRGTVSNSYATGSVTGQSGVGGLTGVNEGIVNNSYSIVSVAGSEYVGGLVGLKDGGDVSNSYAAGSVAGFEYVGGLMGYNYGLWGNSFWDTKTSGQATSDGGAGKGTLRMKNITTFSGSGWDIVAVANPSMRDPSHIWNIVDYETYPFLSWQS